MTPRPIAICPRDGAPLVSTLVFSKAKFYCLDCGGRFGFLQPDAVDPTPEMVDRLAAYAVEWSDHSPDLLGRFWRKGCERCAEHRSYHVEHANEGEIFADRKAREWLAARVLTVDVSS